MPRTEVAKRKKTAKDRLLEAREARNSKKNKGENLTVEDLEDWLETLEDIVINIRAK